MLLRNKEENKRPLSETLILKFFIQICLGLLHLHEKKILHRDLKPQNIFLSRDNDIKIGDFGLAKQYSDDSLDCSPQDVSNQSWSIENTTGVGTPFYLAPELVHEDGPQPYTVKTDVWSLGIILFELCAL